MLHDIKTALRPALRDIGLGRTRLCPGAPSCPVRLDMYELAQKWRKQPGRPGRVVRRQGAMVEVDSGGEAGWYSTLARPEVRTGDWVLTNANVVLTILTREEAAEMVDTVAEPEREFIDGRA